MKVRSEKLEVRKKSKQNLRPKKAATTCDVSDHDVLDHFPGVRKMVEISDHFVDVNKMVELGFAARHYYEL